MFFQKVLLAVAATSASIVSACDPLTSSGCSPDPALASSFKEDFTSASKYFLVVNSKGVSYSSQGLELTISERFDNPSLKSNFYIMFGKVEVVLQAAQGQGIISSFYLQSDDLDEVDIELFGTDNTQFQSNYFSKGFTGNYDRGVWTATGSDPTANFHTYTVDWTKDALSWSVDGQVVRTLLPNNPEGFPQSPMYIMMGSWAGGDPSNSEGTIEWAGGLTNYADAPFSMYIKSVIVADYSTGSEYTYGDQSGSWQSIQSNGGSINGRQSQADSDFAALAGGQDIPTAATTSPSSGTSGTTTGSTGSTTGSTTGFTTGSIGTTSGTTTDATGTTGSTTKTSTGSSGIETGTSGSVTKTTTGSSSWIPTGTTHSSITSIALETGLETTDDSTSTVPVAIVTSAPASTIPVIATTGSETDSTESPVDSTVVTLSPAAPVGSGIQFHPGVPTTAITATTTSIGQLPSFTTITLGTTTPASTIPATTTGTISAPSIHSSANAAPSKYITSSIGVVFALCGYLFFI